MICEHVQPPIRSGGSDTLPVPFTTSRPFPPKACRFLISPLFFLLSFNNTHSPYIHPLNTHSHSLRKYKSNKQTTMAARFLDMALDDVAKSRASNNRSPAGRRGGLRGAGGPGGAGAGSGRDSPNRSNRSSPYSVSFY